MTSTSSAGFAVWIVAVCFLLVPGISQADPSLHLANYNFDPLVATPQLPANLKAAAYSSSELGYYLLQFDGPIKPAWKKAAERRGVEFLDYVPDFAFIVRMPAKKFNRLRDLPHLRWKGIYQPAYRLSQRLLEEKKSRRGRELMVILFPGADGAGFINRVKSGGGKILSRTDSKWKSKVKISCASEEIECLASYPGVKWIEEAPRFKLMNNQARGIIRADPAWTSWSNYSFFGKGQVVAVADSGWEDSLNDPAKNTDDFRDASGNSRVIGISYWSTGEGDIIGHGTHVAGTILGNGANSGGDPATSNYPSTCYAGVAPESFLVVQNVCDWLGNLVGLPNDLNVLFAQAYAGGARIHNDSWGSTIDTSGEYSSYSEDVDEYSWDNQDFTIVFGAGNSGSDANYDGVVDLYSVSAPATAKNCITVGASENYRPPDSDPRPGLDLTYGWYWPFDFPAAPITNSYLSDDPNGIAAFSSRGAQLNSRYKPDLVAPGTNIVSCRTIVWPDSVSLLWGKGGLPPASDTHYYYVFSGGTSMAAPIVSGSAALVRQYYTDLAGITPSSALIKATLLNGARDISPGQYGTGQYQKIPDPPRPNNVEGWGRVDLSSTIFAAGHHDFYYYDVARLSGLTTGVSHQYQVNVGASLLPLSVTLVWTDHPGSTPAAGALVNDLDLTVTDPVGTVYYPNQAVQGGPIYYDSNFIDHTGVHGYEGFMAAVRFTPSCYPATVERGMFFLGSGDQQYSKSFEYRIYAGSSAGPGNLLASGTASEKREGWCVIDFPEPKVVINQGDFYLAIVVPDDDLLWGQDFSEPDGRSWDYSPYTGWDKWQASDYMFRAVVSCPTDQDRTNNVEGIDLKYPPAGNYTVEVTGYNVPYGPQPYALVISRPDHGTTGSGSLVLDSGDYNGDGTSDIAVFRRASGLWAVRGLTRLYFGSGADIPAPGDYNGDGTTDPAVFKISSGLWRVKDVTQVYFGKEGDTPVPADYDGDGTTDVAIFRPTSGLWSVRGISRCYFGQSGDYPVPGNFNNNGNADIAVFRPSNGLWAIKDFNNFYLGGSGDLPVPGDYDSFPGDDMAVFRPSDSRWKVYPNATFYHGTSNDQPVPADYLGTGRDIPAVFRDSSGLWAAYTGVPRVYYGTSGDQPVTGRHTK